MNPTLASTHGRRSGQRGFALLFVFVMAATVAILFYLELPRAAFESQRVKEAMLIERGEQYSRAVKLYVRKWNKYPANLEELENTNNVRYLRRRYSDPLTGKEEWRLIHVGPGGVFTDSLVYDKAKNVKGTESDKEKGKDGKAEAASSFISSGPAFGSTDPLPGTGALPGSRFRLKRPWERDKKKPADGSSPVTADSSQPTDPNAPNTPTGASDPQSAANQQSLGVTPGPFPTMPQSGTTNAGAAPGASNAAMEMIKRILTTPRPGGLMGLQSGGMQIGGGLAGVASKVEEEGIKAYNERTSYNEWEFVYDIRKDTAKAAGMGTGGAPGNLGPGMGPGPGMMPGPGNMPGPGMMPGSGNMPGPGMMPNSPSPFGGFPRQGR